MEPMVITLSVKRSCGQKYEKVVEMQAYFVLTFFGGGAFHHADAGAVGEDELAFVEADAVEEVVGDEEVAVQVGEIDGGGELGGGGDGAGGFGHAAEHDFQSEPAGEFHHLVRVPEAAAFHQLDVDAVEYAHGPLHIVQSLDGFVAEDGQPAALPEPGQVVDPVHGHRLFHHHDAVVPEPVDHVQRLEAVRPSLVHIDGDGEVGDGADGLDEFLVVVRTHLDFQDVETVHAFPGLLLDHLGGVDADGEGRGRGLHGIVAPDPVPGGAEQLAHEVVEGDVDGRLRRAVSGGEAVHVGEDVFQAERVRELLQIHFLQEGGHRVDALAQVGRHRGLAVAGVALVVDFHLHVRRGVAAVGGDGEGMLELELVRIEAELHPAGSDHDGLDRFQGVAAGRYDRIGHPALLAADRQAGADGGQAGHFQEFASVLHGIIPGNRGLS